MTQPEITFLSGGEELLATIQPLWEQLNKHHASISLHFKQDFAAYTFEQRKANILKKHEKNTVRIDIAQIHQIAVAYIVYASCANKVGEIESIFVNEKYRGQGIGKTLMEGALTWLDAQNIEEKVIDIAVGNEEATHFYARFGFYPRIIKLKQIKGWINSSNNLWGGDYE